MQSSMLRHITEDFGNGGTIDGDLTISGDLTVSGGGSLSFDEIIEGTSVIDVTDTEAFLVRKNGDGGDVFIVDTTNSQVGIGVTPTKKLELGGGTSGETLLFSNTGVNTINGARVQASIRYKTGSFAGQNTIQILTETEFDDSSAVVFNTGSGSAERLRIASDGNIGIGNSDPDKTLVVQASGAEVVIADTGTIPTLRFREGGATKGVVRTSSGSMQFYSGGTNLALTIDSSQNVSIGSDSPIAGGGSKTVLTISDSTQSLLVFEDTGFESSGDGLGMFAYNDGTLTYRTASRSGTDFAGSTNRLVIDANGNVGINLSNPDGTLHVHTATAGTVTADTWVDDLVVENSGDGGISILTPSANQGAIAFGDPDDANRAQITYQHSTDTMVIKSGGSTALTIDSSQNSTFGGIVGIEVTPETDWRSSNVTALQVGAGGTVFARKDAGESKIFIAENVKWTSDGFEYINNGLAGYHGLDGGTHTFAVAGSGSADAVASFTTALTINNDGSSTFGGDVTVSKSSDGADSSFTINNSASHGSTDETASLKFQQAGYTGGKIVSNRAFNYSSAGNRDSTLQFYTSQDATDTLAMTIDANQNIGIGVDSPDTNLHILKASAGTVDAHSDAVLAVENSGTTAINILSGNTSHGQLQFGDDGHNDDGVVGYDQATSKFYVLTNHSTTKRLVVDANGNTGLNITPEADWLSTRTALQIGGSGAIFGATASGANGTFNVGQNVYFHSGGSYRRIDADEASMHTQRDGTHIFRVAGSSTDNSTITWTNALTIDNSANSTFAGDVNIGDATGTPDLKISGTNTGTNTAATGHGASNIILHNASATDGNFSFIDGNNSNDAVDSRIVFIHDSHSSRQGEIGFLVHDGSALTERVRLDKNGQLGIGTTSPSSMLHLKSAGSEKPYIIIENNNADVNAPGLKFNKNSASPADGDELGQIIWLGDDDAGNSTGYAGIHAESADVTNGTEDGSLFFSTRVNDSSTKRLSIVGGNVGIGTSSPSSPAGVGKFLHIADTSHAGVVLQDTNSTAHEMYSADGHIYFYSQSAGANTFIINKNGTVQLPIGQLLFPATQNDSSDANTLDDYEEGEHTAVITCGNSGTITLDATNNKLSYVKIGSMVTVIGTVSVSSVSSPDGYFTFSVPFALGDGTGLAKRCSGSVTVYGVSGLDVNQFVVNGIESEARIRVYAGNATSLVNDSANAIVASSAIVVNVTYFV